MQFFFANFNSSSVREKRLPFFLPATPTGIILWSQKVLYSSRHNGGVEEYSMGESKADNQPWARKRVTHQREEIFLDQFLMPAAAQLQRDEKRFSWTAKKRFFSFSRRAAGAPEIGGPKSPRGKLRKRLSLARSSGGEGGVAIFKLGLTNLDMEL